MDANALRALQAPLKERYKQDPDAAVVTLKAQGAIDDARVACKVETGRALAIAGLHPATGGTGAELCSGDMLLEALVACAGVTLKAVATALEIPLRAGTVRAEGDLDFRGTLGVDRAAPVGFRAIRLAIDLDTDAPQEKVDKLLKLTERYCVVFQTLAGPAAAQHQGHARLMRPRAALALVVAAGAASTAAGAAARADQLPPPPERPPAQMPYAIPRQTLIPGTPGMAGGIHLMVNAFGLLQNQGLGGHAITNPGVATGFDGGATRGQLQHDWLMGYSRDERGRFEGLLMLDLEPLTVGAGGDTGAGPIGRRPVGRAAQPHVVSPGDARRAPAGVDGVWRASMMHEPLWDLSIFAGQGSATIGPPVFMHRASSPGPTVPRKHHKGENPHETSPVIGAALRYDVTTVEASIFGAQELGAQRQPLSSAPVGADLVRGARAPRFRGRPRAADLRRAPARSGRRRARRVAGERQRILVEARFGGMRMDALLDWGLDRPDVGPSAQAALAEAALRSADRRAVGWMRSRGEPARGAARRARRGQLALAVRDRRVRIFRLGIARVGRPARRLFGSDLHAHSRRAGTDVRTQAGGRDERRPAPVRHVDVRLRLPPDAPRSLKLEKPVTRDA